MKDLPPLYGRFMSAFVVLSVGFSSLMALGTLSNVRAAAQCSQSNVVIGGDWTVTGNEVCEGTLYTMTGDLTINLGASLTLRDGGIQFAQTPATPFSVLVQGTLILDNSTITVTGDTMDPYLALHFTMSSGMLNMVRDSVLAFPGWLTTTGGTFRMDHSSIRALPLSDVQRWAADVDEYDDAPAMSFTDTTVSIFDSGLYNLFEKFTLIPDPRRHVNLMGGTHFVAINSHIAIDLSNETTTNATHNTLEVIAPATAFLLWPTINENQTPVHTYEYSNAVNVTGATAAYVYRRVDVSVVDLNDAPVAGATLRMTYTGTTRDAEYPDNSPGAIIPGNAVLSYLGRDAVTWKQTNVSGQATIPLVSDMIDSTGVYFEGNYNVSATFGGNFATQQIGLAHWPLEDLASNVVAVTLRLGFAQLLPDLKPSSMSFSPLQPKLSEPITIDINISNAGLGPAGRFAVRVYDNIILPGALMHEENITTLAAGASYNLTTFTWRFNTSGSHSIRVIVDPLHTVYEGPPDSPQEMNNDGAFALVVFPPLPDLEPVVNAATGFAGSPIDLTATILNNGDANATGVIVDFFIDTLANKIGTVSIPDDIQIGGSYDAAFSWTPPGTGTYTVYAWVDPNNAIVEFDENNNVDSNTLVVNPAPNPTAYPEDLRASDPFPTAAITSPVSFSAVVRNIGQADITSNFDVTFSLDEGPVLETVSITASPAAPMRIGDFRLVSTVNSYLVGNCGFHSLKVVIDSGNAINEGSAYEQDNIVTRTLQVFKKDPAPITYSGAYQLKYLPIAQNVIVSGDMTIKDGNVIVTEPQEACGRVFIKVTGILRLVNSTIAARDGDNWPVVMYVSGTGRIVASEGSRILLNTDQGDGLLEVGGTGVVELTDTLVQADVNIHGSSAFLNRVAFQSEKLAANTNGLTKIWDTGFQGTTALALRSEDASLASVDVDLRNTTFDATLTSQLVFGGHQYAHITNVTTTKMTRWWEGMITQSAKVTRFWWLKVEAVDGTGAVLRPESNTNISLYRMNTVTLRNENLPNPIPGNDIFGTNSTTWPVLAPHGTILYKAASEDRFASVQSQYMNATYTATGNATINGTVYRPDNIVTLFLDENLVFRLEFSRLTPDLSVSSISFSGENGNGIQQPINRIVTITATIANTGQIDVPAVWVNFYYTDVDTNGDNLMDLANSSYLTSFIGQQLISVPLNGTAPAIIVWDKPVGFYETTYIISVVVDPPVGDPADGGIIMETDEFNNIMKTPLYLYTWPDLHIEASQIHVPPAIQGNPVTITVDIMNTGTNDASDAEVELEIGGTTIYTSDPFTVSRSGTASTILRWTPQRAGSHTLNFTVTTSGGMRNMDYNTVDNSASTLVYVARPPDLAVLQTDFAGQYNMTQRGSFQVSVKIYNLGDTGATGFTLGIFLRRAGEWPPLVSDQLSLLVNLSLASQSNSTHAMLINSIPAIETAGTYQFTVWVDSTKIIGEESEANNAVNVTLNVLVPVGEFTLSTTPAGQEFKPGDTFSIVGMIQTVTGGEPIPNLPLNMTMRKQGEVQPVFVLPNTCAANGYFTYFDVQIPPGTSDGTYELEFTSQGGIQPLIISITVESPKEWTIFGLPWWMFLLIIIVIVVVIVGVIIYTKRVGLGRLVECGECGAFIPEDSVKCPKCGVEFEKDMAKCSNCQAWIPLDVKQCPECGVEFATGEVEMADYEQKMRVQYDEVKKKFREQAQAEIGRPLSDEEFDAWWKKQPSFLTFEDWLRDEEEMRKMGSKPCPSCGTLNSVNATVCHKCGTLMKKEEPKKRPPPKEEQKEPERVAQAPQAAEPRPVEPVPKKVVVKKPVTPTVIQKKVVVRRPGEGQEGAGGSEGTPSEEEI
jgi:subtilase family serine protease/ribosomal protein L40E